MKPTTIQICTNNEICDNIKYLDRLSEKYGDAAEITPKNCLGHCEICRQMPYVLLNGEMVTGKTVKKLFQNLDRKMEELEKQETVLSKQGKEC